MPSLIAFFGRCHPVLVHLPIGFLLLALVFQWVPRRATLRAAAQIAFLLGMISAVLSCVSGWLLSSGGEYDAATLSLHKWFGIGVAALSAIGYAFTTRRDTVFKHIISATMMVLIFITGHLGGTLTHGEGFLTKGSASSNASDASPRKPLVQAQEALVFDQIIQPILIDKCGGCHGASKQKGGLRLDAKEWILKGGKNGPVFENGHAAASELYRRITLDPLDEKHMAPKGKPQLSEQELQLVAWWIDSKAGFDKKVKDVPQTPAVAALLKAMEQRDASAAVSYLPAAPVDAAKPSVLDTLRNRGITLLPVAANSAYLLANFVSLPRIDAHTVSLLQQVRAQLVWLKLGYASLTDESWRVIGSCTQLTRLSIEHTNISDAQLGYLKELRQLRYLNLVGTKVTAKGLEALKGLSQLKQLYLGQTGVQGTDWINVQRLFPGARIDSGNYRTRFIATDTQLLKPPPRKK